jgi:hypothetical protein
MADHLALTKPTVGGDEDTWGTELNSDLDDIQDFAGSKGTWTPTDASGAGLALTINGAGYSRIADEVKVWLDVSFPVTADGTNIKFGGLPFDIENTAGVGGAFPVIGPGAGSDFCLLIPNTKTFQPYTGLGVNRTNSQYSNTRVRIQFWYPAA